MWNNQLEAFGKVVMPEVPNGVSCLAPRLSYRNWRSDHPTGAVLNIENPANDFHLLHEGVEVLTFDISKVSRFWDNYKDYLGVAENG